MTRDASGTFSSGTEAGLRDEGARASARSGVAAQEEWKPDWRVFVAAVLVALFMGASAFQSQAAVLSPAGTPLLA